MALQTFAWAEGTTAIPYDREDEDEAIYIAFNILANDSQWKTSAKSAPANLKTAPKIFQTSITVALLKIAWSFSALLFSYNVCAMRRHALNANANNCPIYAQNSIKFDKCVFDASFQKFLISVFRLKLYNFDKKALFFVPTISSATRCRHLSVCVRTWSCLDKVSVLCFVG